MMNRIGLPGFFAMLVFLGGCSDGGGKFEGKWSCDSDVFGKTSLSIRHNDGNQYIINISNQHMTNGSTADSGSSVTYKDGQLIAANGTAIAIDKQSGKLLLPGFCEMTKSK
jgi:hypothetical protein